MRIKRTISIMVKTNKVDAQELYVIKAAIKDLINETIKYIVNTSRVKEETTIEVKYG